VAQTEDWEAEAATFDEQPDHGLRDPEIRSAWTELLTAALPEPPATVLDLGCGTGTLSTLLAGAGYKVTGVDSSTAMRREAAAKAAQAGVDITLIDGDAGDPPVSSRYEVVLCRHVLWALPNTDHVIARWRDLIAPGGRLVLIEGQWDTGGGIPAAALLSTVACSVGPPQLTRLTDSRLWGREITDERYLITADPGR
jgi:SAM-dependent methyltransferase